MGKCPICKRKLGDVLVNGHHLIPKEMGGKEVIALHKICHDKIHHTFANHELASVYNTVEMIVSHPEIIKFIKWIKNKEPSFYDKSKDTAHRRSKRRKR